MITFSFIQHYLTLLNFKAVKIGGNSLGLWELGAVIFEVPEFFTTVSNRGAMDHKTHSSDPVMVFESQISSFFSSAEDERIKFRAH